jgi:archaemetzincin
VLAVDVVSVGDVDADAAGFVREGLARELGARVTHLGAVPVPAGAYNAERCQYSSTRVLDEIGGPAGHPGAIRLALTGIDLYAADLNFVFGEARPQERDCIISLARLGSDRGGRPVDRGLLPERALKEAIHEIGHVLGLGHCGARDCVMFFSNGIAGTDRKQTRFCDACRRSSGLYAGTSPASDGP